MSLACKICPKYTYQSFFSKFYMQISIYCSTKNNNIYMYTTRSTEKGDSCTRSHKYSHERKSRKKTKNRKRESLRRQKENEDPKKMGRNPPQRRHRLLNPEKWEKPQPAPPSRIFLTGNARGEIWRETRPLERPRVRVWGRG